MTNRRMMMPLRVVAIGPLPPPPGGVASSLQSLLDATRERDDINIRVIRWTEMWRLPMLRPHVLHLHFSRPFKRLLGTAFGRLLGAKVAHTIHGNNFDFNNLGNRLALSFSQGVILLNTDIQQHFESYGITNSVLMTPILASPASETVKPLDPSLGRWIDRRGGKIATIYTHDRRESEGYDLYGFGFVADLLPQLHAMGWSVIFLDPFGVYEPGEIFPPECPNAVLHSSNVEFSALLARSDAYLRPTSTDGNSVAVLEALAQGVPVIASDVVPRPPGARLFRFKDGANFLSQFELLDRSETQPTVPRLTSATEYVDFMRVTMQLWAKGENQNEYPVAHKHDDRESS